MLLWLTLLFVALTPLAYLAVGRFYHWAKQQMLDMPNARSAHQTPTPRGGGVIFVGLTLLFTTGYSLYTHSLPLLAYTLAAALIAAMSWQDDKKSVSSLLRFGTHLLGALLVTASFGPLTNLPLPLGGSLLLPPLLAWSITLFWLVGLTNAYNFMDGLDGLAGLQGFIAAVGWFIWAWSANHLFFLLMAVVLGAGVFAFLGHNWPPARLFMGDVGSAFLGFTLAALPLMAFSLGGGDGHPTAELLLFSAVILWPFLFDTTLTLLKRAKNRENIFQAHRSHLYQKLSPARYTPTQITLLYGGLSTWGTGLALGWLLSPTPHLYAGLLLISLPLLALLLYRHATPP